jgi:hypothetical protein
MRFVMNWRSRAGGMPRRGRAHAAMAAEDEVGSDLAEAFDERTVRMDMGAARLPRGRTDHQQSLAGKVEFAPMRTAGEPFEQGTIDVLARARSPCGAKNPLLVIAEDDLGLLAQDAHDHVGECSVSMDRTHADPVTLRRQLRVRPVSRHEQLRLVREKARFL